MNVRVVALQPRHRLRGIHHRDALAADYLRLALWPEVHRIDSFVPPSVSLVICKELHFALRVRTDTRVLAKVVLQRSSAGLRRPYDHEAHRKSWSHRSGRGRSALRSGTEQPRESVGP